MSAKIIIGLPAYNEQVALPKIFEKIQMLREKMGDVIHMVVVNDGSKDGTERILKELSRQHSFISYINHASNQGLGQAMNTLFNHVIEHHQDSDILFTFDADNTHNPNLIPEMARKLKVENLDLVIASRFTSGGKEIGLSVLRKLFSRGAKLFFKLFFPIHNVHDYSSGYRGYSIQYLKKAIQIYNGKLITSNGFECMAEIAARFSKIGVNASEYPLVLEYNLKEGKSKMRVLRTILGYFALIYKVKNPCVAQKMKAQI
jgi:dolichol-phosphate mannosyltransferase